MSIEQECGVIPDTRNHYLERVLEERYDPDHIARYYERVHAAERLQLDFLTDYDQLVKSVVLAERWVRAAGSMIEKDAAEMRLRVAKEELMIYGQTAQSAAIDK